MHLPLSTFAATCLARFNCVHLHVCAKSDMKSKHATFLAVYHSRMSVFVPSLCFCSVRMQDAARLGTAHFMTEFGACAESPACIREIRRSAVAADEHLSSWAYWSYKYFNGTARHGEYIVCRQVEKWAVLPRGLHI